MTQFAKCTRVSEDLAIDVFMRRVGPNLKYTMEHFQRKWEAVADGEMPYFLPAAYLELPYMHHKAPNCCMKSTTKLATAYCVSTSQTKYVASAKEACTKRESANREEQAWTEDRNCSTQRRRFALEKTRACAYLARGRGTTSK